MADYQDKEFRKNYSEIIENVKTNTTKWDPSVSDESDPGVAILKAFGLFTDKVQYRINHRDCQNSVKRVTDVLEGEELFNGLGYQMKKKKSASGELSIKNIGESTLVLPLFTEFSNQSGNLVYTSVRSRVSIGKGETKLVKVQEGVSRQYTYEGVELFGPENLTTDLRLPLLGIGDISDNAVIISSKDYDKEVSDWLNINDNYFNSVETNKVFSIGHDYEGIPYIQFYEQSISALVNGIYIWIISSSGSAGNIGQNKIGRIQSTLQEGDSTQVIITHGEFINGQDQESLSSAMENYYKTLGLNDTLVGERDYSVATEGVLDPYLNQLTSKTLVTGVDGYHNLVEIVHNLGDDKRVILTRFITEVLASAVFVNALKVSNDYYQSFEYLKSEEAQNLIRKALYKKSVVSNEIKVVDGEEGDNSGLYSKYLFDLVTAIGTIIIDSYDPIDDIKAKVVSIISDSFNSSKIQSGEMISESKISEKIKEGVKGVIDASFYYSDHNLVKSINTLDKLTIDEKRDIVARSVLRGDLPLFKESSLQITPGATPPTYYSSVGATNTSIQSIKGGFTIGNQAYTTGVKLLKNEVVQFYTIAKEDDNYYGLGIGYRLLSNKMYEVPERTHLQSTSKFKYGSVIKAGSKLYSATGINDSTINSNFPGTVDAKNGIYTFLKDYTVASEISADPSSDGSYLEIGSLLCDFSILNGNEIHAISIPDQQEFDLLANGATLLIELPDGDVVQYPNDSTNLIRPEGFGTKGFQSSGLTGSPIEINGEIKRLNSEKIYTLRDSTQVLPHNVYCGLYLKKDTQTSLLTGGKATLSSDKKTLTLKKGISFMLDEDEHLIYTDENLLDFVDLGSGTYFTVQGDDVQIKVIDYSGDISTQVWKLQGNGELKISNTQIYTFANGETVVYPRGVTTSKDWAQIPNGEKFIIKDESGNELYTFGGTGSTYFHREGLLLNTDVMNIISLAEGQYITLTQLNGEEEVIQGSGTVGDYTLVSFSSQIKSSMAPLSVADANLSMAEYSLIGNFNNTKGIYQYSEDGFTISATVDKDGDGVGRFPIQSKGYLIEIEVNLTSGNLRVGGSSETASTTVGYEMVYLLNSKDQAVNSDMAKITKSGTYQILFLGQKNVSNLNFIFTGAKAGDSVSILRFKEIDGISDQVNFEESEDQAYITGEINFEENLTLKNSNTHEWANLIRSIDGYTKNGGDGLISFDYFYSPEAQVSQPTEALKFYDSQHLMNRNIIMVLDTTKLLENLKIVRRSSR